MQYPYFLQRNWKPENERGRSMNVSSRMLVRWRRIFILVGLLSIVPFRGIATSQTAMPTNPVEEGVVKLADSNIEYFSQGKGEPIVLLPFGSLTVEYLKGLSQDLADAGYQVVRINFRGSG